MSTPVRWVAVVVPVIIVGFVAAHAASIPADGALLSAARHIQWLGARESLASSMRSDLLGMAVAISRAVQATEDGPFDRASFDAYRASLRGRLARLRGSPMAQEAKSMIATVAATDDALALAAARLEAGQRAAAFGEDTRASMRAADLAFEGTASATEEAIDREAQQVAAIARRVKRLGPIDDAGALVAVILMVLAVLGARRYAKVVDERNRESERRAQELDLFAGRVAHDLKNPLSAMSMRVALLRPFFNDAALRSKVVALQASVARMDHVVDGLLVFARAGGRPQPGAVADLGVVVEELLPDFLLEAERDGVELTVGGSVQSLAVGCPPEPLASVIGNLVRNAIKYVVASQKRWVRVDARAVGSARVRVEVEDTGPGIPTGQRNAIFEPFVRVGDQTRPGIGLGLATVKRIVEAYAGSVGVEPRLGGGSCFWFELPTGRANNPAQAPNPPSPIIEL